MQVINLNEKFNLFSEQWSPKIIATLNDHHFKVAKIQGEFVSHKHEDSDEAFIVLKGEMFIESPEQTIKIQEGEMCVVDKNTIHKPFALSECWIMLVELAGTVNTGDSNSANLESTAGSKI
ncbi:MAG: cupin domain-containing protein [Pseudomonadota bacterium]|nr:cupin [Porticoccaceae bacterium]MEC7636864.1 cupin domain-containing protein [Pseudomonadota bacterium]MEC8469863.1 cupin domain-containing protein [Pseudomonadota bacterium]MEC8499514.1 cupin domain-containing protein [Pseudomonadota bacterium]